MTADLDLRARRAVTALRDVVDASIDDAATDAAFAAVIDQVGGVVAMPERAAASSPRRWVVLASVAAASLVILVVLLRDHRPAPPVVPVPTSTTASATTLPSSTAPSTTAPPTTLGQGTSTDGTLPTVGPSMGDEAYGYQRQAFALRDGRVIYQSYSFAPEEFGTSTVKVYDPATDELTKLGRTVVVRYSPAVVEVDGRLLFVGADYTPFVNNSSSPAATATAEVMDLATGSSTLLGPLPGLTTNPERMVATALSDGRVLIVASGDTRAWVFDPADDSFTPTAPRTLPASDLDEVFPMTDGRAVVLSATPEVFDPATATFTALSSTMASGLGAAVQLPDGRVLAFHGSYCGEVHTLDAKGLSEGYQPASTMILDPVKDTVTTGPQVPHCVTSAALLPSGRVFVAGYWWDKDGEVNWSGVFDPGTGETTPAPAPNRQYGVAVPMQDGRVLLVAGKATTWADAFVEGDASP